MIEESEEKMATNKQSTTTNADRYKNALAGFIAIMAIIGFALFVGFLAVLLLGQVDPTQWERYTYLLTGIETITFAAVGWLFGKEVHREQAQNADQRANDAQQQTVQAEKHASEAKTKLTTLNTAIHVKRDAHLGKINYPNALVPTQGSGGEAIVALYGTAKNDWDELVNLADQLAK